MFSIKYRDNRGSESLIRDVDSVSFHEGVVTAFRPSENVTFGPNMGDFGPNPIVFVMNENGATIAKYELAPMLGPREYAQNADPEKLVA